MRRRLTPYQVGSKLVVLDRCGVWCGRICPIGESWGFTGDFHLTRHCSMPLHGRRHGLPRGCDSESSSSSYRGGSRGCFSVPVSQMLSSCRITVRLASVPGACAPNPLKIRCKLHHLEDVIFELRVIPEGTERKHDTKRRDCSIFTSSGTEVTRC